MNEIILDLDKLGSKSLRQLRKILCSELKENDLALKKMEAIPYYAANRTVLRRNDTQLVTAISRLNVQLIAYGEKIV